LAGCRPHVDCNPRIRFLRVGGEQNLRALDLAHRAPPAEADFQRFFHVTPPTVHAMIVALEHRGLISRVPRQPRTIRLLLSPQELPALQPIKTTATGY